MLALPDYDLYIVHARGDNDGPLPIHQLIPARVIHFNRVDLLTIAEDGYDQNGNFLLQSICGPTRNPGQRSIRDR